MSTTPSEQRKAEQKASKDDLIQYVEELAGPEDAWISLTDAARITRTSEAMTRRWVTSGRLKVKKEPVGVPPRTRLVRMSDVAAIRPIVDPTAAITGEVRKLDLASIPRQQLQIVEDHQRLTKLIQDVLEEARQHETSTQAVLEQVTASFRELAAEHEQFAEETRQTRQVHQQQYQALAHHDEEQQQHIQRVRDSLTESLHHLGQSLHQELVGQQEQHQHNLEQLRTHLLDQLKAAQQEWERTLSKQDQEHRSQVDEVRRALAQQQEAITTLREALTTLIEQQVREVVTALEQLARDQAHDVATLTESLEQLTQRIEQVATRAETAQTTVASYQKRADAQDQLIQTLTTSLQEEREARKTFSEQLAAQQGQMQALRREIDGVKRQKA